MIHLHYLLVLFLAHGGGVVAAVQDLGSLDVEGIPVGRSLTDVVPAVVFGLTPLSSNRLSCLSVNFLG